MPYLTAELPGVGGVIKQHDEDFAVQELPLYLPCGSGTHVYFVIEKQGLPTLAAVQHIARALGRQPRDIGYAGLKDAHGVTRQMLSVEHVDPARLQALEFTRMKILSVDRHTNKLKLGHLAGNRFEIKIRDDDGRSANAPVRGQSGDVAIASSSALRRAQAILDVLVRRGAPNYFGPQRFGARGDNGAIGDAILRGDHVEAIALMLGRPGPTDHGAARRARELFDRGDFEGAANVWPRGIFAQQSRLCRAHAKNSGDAKKTWRAVDHTLRKLYLSAFQSALFNRVLAARITGLECIETGDIAWKHVNGACFRVEDVEREQPRCAAFEISPTGPLFGRRMTEASGRPGEIESAVLAECGIVREKVVSEGSGRLDGARRPLRVPLGDPRLENGEDEYGGFLKLAFTLPAGAYATVVLRELCKAPEN